MPPRRRRYVMAAAAKKREQTSETPQLQPQPDVFTHDTKTVADKVKQNAAVITDVSSVAPVAPPAVETKRAVLTKLIHKRKPKMAFLFEGEEGAKESGETAAERKPKLAFLFEEENGKHDGVAEQKIKEDEKELAFTAATTHTTPIEETRIDPVKQEVVENSTRGTDNNTAAPTSTTPEQPQRHAMAISKNMRLQRKTKKNMYSFSERTTDVGKELESDTKNMSNGSENAEVQTNKEEQLQAADENASPSPTVDAESIPNGISKEEPVENIAGGSHATPHTDATRQADAVISKPLKHSRHRHARQTEEAPLNYGATHACPDTEEAVDAATTRQTKVVFNLSTELQEGSEQPKTLHTSAEITAASDTKPADMSHEAITRAVNKKSKKALTKKRAMKKKAADEETARKRAAEEEAAARKKATEEEAARKKAAEEEAARKKAAEEEAARKKAAEEEAARKKAAEEEAARKKAAEEEAARKKAAEEEAARKKAAEEEAARKKAAEEEAARKKAAEEEAARKKAAEEEAARKKAAEEEARKAAEEEAARKKARRDARRKAREEAARKKAEEEAARRKARKAARKKAAEEEAARKKAVEEEAARKKAAEEEAARKKAAEEEAARNKAAEEEAARKRAAEEEAARKKAAEEEARKAAEEEAARKKAAEEEAARKKAAEEEARKAAEEEAARKKAAEEEAARKKAAEEEAARKKAAEEEAARKKAAKEEVAKKVKEEQDAEVTVKERRKLAKKKIERYRKQAATRRPKPTAEETLVAAATAQGVVDVPLVRVHSSGPTPTSNAAAAATATSEETLLADALTFPNGSVTIEQFDDDVLVARRCDVEDPWDIGLRFDWTVKTLAIGSMPMFGSADPRRLHPFMQRYQSRPVWFLEEVNGAKANNIREVMEVLKKSLTVRFVFRK